MKDFSAFPRGLDLHHQIQGLRGMARALVGRDDAEDLLARIYVKVTERPPDSVKDIRGWLARVLRNEAIDASRSDGRRKDREERWSTQVSIEAPPEILAQDEAHHALRHAMEELDPASQRVLKLRYYHGETPAEIANELGITVVNARVRLTRALAALRLTMKRKYGNAWNGMCLFVAGRKPEIHAVQSTSYARALLLGVSGALSLIAVAFLLLGEFERPDAPMESGLEAFGGEMAEKVTSKVPISLPASSKDGRSEDPMHPINGPGIITIEDEQGAKVKALRPIVFWAGNTKYAKPIEGKLGLYSVEVPLESILAEDEDSVVLFSAFGWAPDLISLKSIVATGGLIKLDGNREVSGEVYVPDAFKCAELFLSLSLAAIRPAPGDKRFEFRETLPVKQKKLFDRKFAFCSTSISSDGRFRFRGIDREWSGHLRFSDKRLNLVGANQRGAFQEIEFLKPSRGMSLSLEAKPHARILLLPPVGAQELGDFGLNQIVDASGNLVSNAVYRGDGANQFLVFGKEFPVGEIFAEIRQLGIAGAQPLTQIVGTTNEYYCRLPMPYRPNFTIVDKAGLSLQGIEVFADGITLGVTGADGTVDAIVPGYVKRFQINNSAWLPMEWEASRTSHALELNQVSGIEILLSSEMEIKDGFLYELELIAPNGIRELPGRLSEDGGWKSEMRTVVEGGVGERSQIQKTLAQIGSEITFFGDFHPGVVRVKVFVNGRVVGNEEVVFGELGEFKRLQVSVDCVPQVDVKGVVHLPNGMPAGGARIFSVNENGLSLLSSADDYGEYSLAKVPQGSRLCAKKFGYQVSDLYLVGAHPEQRCNFHVKRGRQIEIEMEALADWNSRGPVNYQVTRLSDGLHVHHGSIHRKTTKLDGLPVEDCELSLWGEGWRLSRRISPLEDSFSIEERPARDLCLIGVPESIAFDLNEVTEFETPLGTWHTVAQRSSSVENALEIRVLPCFGEDILWKTRDGLPAGIRNAHNLWVRVVDCEWISVRLRNDEEALIAEGNE